MNYYCRSMFQVSLLYLKISWKTEIWYSYADIPSQISSSLKPEKKNNPLMRFCIMQLI